ncbi:hypothetical protein C9980_25695 [Vibrio mediterranei]|uniref:hypothetical protein n=1 Tax=Vibrio mediterranei TaxID=689 RepID=UPI000D183D6D|nr:hypothetical protein [Vibrio mediterranei]PTC01914.1 hypothetical protein C9980_25695 [Vibrio mediterranei]
MIEILAKMQNYGLLTPISTVLTAGAALLVVFINNKFVRTNLTNQLKAHSSENEKQRVEEARIRANKNKQEKIEELSEYFDQYMDEFEQCCSIVVRISTDWETTSSKSIKEIRSLRDRYSLSQKYLHKSEIFANSYTDNISLVFDTIRDYEVTIQKHLEFLLLFEYQLGDRDHRTETELERLERRQLTEQWLISRRNYDTACKGVRQEAVSIRKAIIKELRSTVI